MARFNFPVTAHPGDIITCMGVAFSIAGANAVRYIDVGDRHDSYTATLNDGTVLGPFPTMESLAAACRVVQ